MKEHRNGLGETGFLSIKALTYKFAPLYGCGYINILALIRRTDGSAVITSSSTQKELNINLVVIGHSAKTVLNFTQLSHNISREDIIDRGEKIDGVQCEHLHRQ